MGQTIGITLLLIGLVAIIVALLQIYLRFGDDAVEEDRLPFPWIAKYVSPLRSCSMGTMLLVIGMEICLKY